MSPPVGPLPFPPVKPKARLDLLCFNYAGGSTAIYRDWNRLFPDWIAVRPVEMPGHGARLGETPERDAERLVARLATEIGPHLDGPFAIFGHSLGAVLGFRVALAFAAEGRPPLAFFPSGRHGPFAPSSAAPRAHLDDAGLVEAMRALNGSPPEVLENRELMALLLPIVRADFILSETIGVPAAARLACPVHAFGGEADGEVPSARIGEWRETTTGAFGQTLVRDGHFFLHQPGHVAVIRERITSVLAPLLHGHALETSA